MIFVRLQWFGAGLCLLLLCACRQESADAPPVGPVSIAPSPTPAPKLTPSQLASILRVRVAFGGLPPQDTIGALLSHEEIPLKSLAEGHCRIVLASLKGWREEQLRSDQVRIFIYRNKVDQTGATALYAFTGRLIQFDKDTGLAVLAYLDNFDYAQDRGFHLRVVESASGQVAVRTLYDPDAPLPSPDSSQPAAKAFQLDVANYSGTDNFGQAPSGMTPAPQQAVLNGEDGLVGFIADGVLTRADSFKLAIRLPMLDVMGTSFDTHAGAGRYRIGLTIQPEDAGDMPRQIRLLMREIPQNAPPETTKTDASGVYAPITGSLVDLREWPGGEWSAALDSPIPGEQHTYQMQITWPLFRQDFNQQDLGAPDVPQVYGKPFPVTVDVDESGVHAMMQYPAASAATSTSTASAAIAGAPVSYSLGAAAKSIHMVAGGRYALFEFAQEPWWKLFSFESESWIPLPDGLWNSSVTGNLDSLFILDRSMRRIRKFSIAGLVPEGAVTLPPGDYGTILAGCNSANAPLHVIERGETLELDPHTLERRNVPGSSPIKFDPAEPISISGDGLGLWPTRRPYVTTSYNNDEHGLENSYLGAPTQ